MKKHIYNEYGLVKTVEAEPVCGEHFCDSCGDCLHCYVDQRCVQCVWIEYHDKENTMVTQYQYVRLLNGDVGTAMEFKDDDMVVVQFSATDVRYVYKNDLTPIRFDEVVDHIMEVIARRIS